MLPAKKLTDKQMALVDTLVAEGCSIAKAAELAGYAKGESGRVSAHRALKATCATVYAQGAKSEYVQLEASKDLLDRAGYKPIDRAQVQVAGDIRVSIDLG